MENTQKNNTPLQYVFYNNSCSEYLAFLFFNSFFKLKPFISFLLIYLFFCFFTAYVNIAIFYFL